MRAFGLVVSLALLAVGAEAFTVPAPLGRAATRRHLTPRMIAEDEAGTANLEEEDFEPEPVSTYGSTAYVTDSPPEDASITWYARCDCQTLFFSPYKALRNSAH